MAPGERQDTLPISAFLDRAVERLDEDLAGQPQVQTRMRSILGTVYEGLGAHGEAEPLLLEVLDSNDLPEMVRVEALTSLGRIGMGRGTMRERRTPTGRRWRSRIGRMARRVR